MCEAFVEERDRKQNEGQQDDRQGPGIQVSETQLTHTYNLLRSSALQLQILRLRSGSRLRALTPAAELLGTPTRALPLGGIAHVRNTARFAGKLPASLI